MAFYGGSFWSAMQHGFEELGSAIGSGAKKFGNWIGGLWNDFTGKTSNEANLGFQRENLDYQKALQQEVFNREDDAYQRTVADMRSAGLNPLSMSGQNGAGEAIATNSIQGQKTSDLQAVNEIVNVLNQVTATRNNASLSQAQSNLINAQADNQKIKNLYEEDLLAKGLEGLNLDNIGKRFSNESANIKWLNEKENYNFNQAYGLTENMPDFVKMSLLMSDKKAHTGSIHSFSRDWDSFGRTFEDHESPLHWLESSKLSGAIMENQLLNGLLSWLPGLGKVLGR